MMRFHMSLAPVVLAAMATAAPALAGDDWRERKRDRREVARSYAEVRDAQRDLARAQWRGNPREIREEARELRRAERDLQRDRARLYRTGWDDDRRRGRWDDDHRRRGNNGWGRGGRPGKDWRYDRNGWNRPGWAADRFYVDDRRYRPRYLGRNDAVWRGYDNRYYCRRSDGTTGLIVGGLAGGALGNVLAPGGSKLLGSLIGGGLGAVVGNGIDRNRVVCR